MNQSVDLSSIKALSVPDRILVVEEIWDSIAADRESVPVTATQRDELDRRIKDFEASPNDGSSWQEAKARIQRRE